MRIIALASLLAWTACEQARDREDADTCASSIHACGIQDPQSPNFHGALLRDLDWSFATCAGCHGQDFSGGSSGASCRGCHAEGPTACDTCHGEVPTSGAHTTHVAGGALERRFECATCHRVPESWDDAGHILRDGVADPAPAELAFAAAAGVDAAYDAATGRCTGVACHGAELDDTAATVTEPVWTGGAEQAACGTCHGEPPASHADDRCEACHRPVAAPDRQFARTDLHVDGVVQAGRACTDCHGGAAAGAAPGPDLIGETSPLAVTVGAHLAHVTQFRLRAPMTCADCHTQPDDVEAPGHIDSPGPAEVFPGGPAFPALAAAAGAMPSWDRAAATCGDVYCHGGGTRQADDGAAGLRRTPRWTAVGQGEAVCGTCHGVPPLDGVHDPDLALTDCATCHPSTVDAAGNILITGGDAPTSEHIDGTVDL